MQLMLGEARECPLALQFNLSYGWRHGSVECAMRCRDFVVVLLGVATIYVPVSFFPAPDLRIFLFPWLHHIEVAGPVGVFAHPFANYSPPYLYLLSLFSTFGLPDLWTIKLL